MNKMLPMFPELLLMCSIDGCERPYYSRGMCEKHYRRTYYLAHREQMIAQDMERYFKHRAEILVKFKARYAANRDKRLAHDKAWRASNPEKVRARQAAYYVAHHEQVAAQQLGYRRAHPEQARADHARRRLRIGKSRGQKLQPGEWEAILRTYSYRCAYCGFKHKRLTMDHVVPVSKGGKHVASNIVPACKPCNSKKGTGLPLKPVGLVLL